MKALYQSMLAATVLVTASLALGDQPIWTETFDDGVGLLDQTRGNGDSVFFWDAETQSIDGTFNFQLGKEHQRCLRTFADKI